MSKLGFTRFKDDKIKNTDAETILKSSNPTNPNQDNKS